MRRIAAIDIGTNSTRLLVADVSGKCVQTVATKLITTRLGEGLGARVLLPGAVERTLEAIDFYYLESMRLGAERVIAAATSAVRDAVNRSEFLELVRQRFGLEVRVLGGLEEAALSYRGVLSGLPVEPCATIVVDVGGGSTELVWHESGKLACVSMNAGAVRLTSAGWSEEGIAALLKPALDMLRGYSIKHLVGVGGTATTLAAADQRLTVYNPALVHGYSLTAGAIANLFNIFRSLPIEARKQLPGLQPERADIIVAGVAIVQAVLAGTGMDHLLVSECDILHGLVLDASK